MRYMKIALRPALWYNKLNSCLQLQHPMLMLILVPAALLLILLPADEPWRAVT